MNPIHPTLHGPPRYGSHGLLDAGLAARDHALIDDAAARRARTVAAALPAMIGRALCLECRLGPDGPHAVDLSVHVDRDGGAELAPCALAPCDGARAWERVRTLCRAWAAPGTLAHQLVDHLWLEFDLPPHPLRGAHAGWARPDCLDDELRIPTPSVFLALDRDSVASGRATAGPVLRMLAPLRGAPASAAVRHAVDHALAALPVGVALEAVAVMLARDATRVRLCPARLSAAEWPRWLRRLGAERLAAGLAAAVDGVLSAADPIALGHVDVGADGIAERVGVEITLDRASQRRGVLREQGLLDRLVARGWCTPVHRDALLHWPGASTAQLPHRLWRSIVARHVNDVKLVIDAAGACEAKAYLVIAESGRAR